MPVEMPRLLPRTGRAAGYCTGFAVAIVDALHAAFAQATDEAASTIAVPSVAAELPRDLTPWGMYLSADPLVKGVLICLVLASIVTWTVWLAKTFELIAA